MDQAEGNNFSVEGSIVSRNEGIFGMVRINWESTSYIAQVRTLITDVYFRHVRAFQPGVCGLRYRDDYRERGESGWTIKSTT